MDFQVSRIKERNENIDEYIKRLIPEERMNASEWNANDFVGIGYEDPARYKFEGHQYVFGINPIRVNILATVGGKNALVYLFDEAIQVTYAFEWKKKPYINWKKLQLDWKENKTERKKKEISGVRLANRVNLHPMVFLEDSKIIPLDKEYYDRMLNIFDKYSDK
ncbi:MAG: hypothetical protein ACP5NV_02245 [Candidatus Woesearchaeota archaeon]